MKSSEVLSHTGNERAFRELIPMVTGIEDPTSSSSSDEDCGLVDAKRVPMDIWKQILKKCDTRTKMRLMGTSKFFRKMLDTDEFWHEIVVEELPRLRDNIYMSQSEFQDLDTYDPSNADDVADKTRFGLSPKGWKDTIRLYGTFPEVLFGKRQGFWKDFQDLKRTIENPWLYLIVFTLTWVSLALFLFLFFFAIFYSTNFIRGPVFDKLSDDGHVSNLLTNKVTRSVFSFSLSRSKFQFSVSIVMLALFFYFLIQCLVKLECFWITLAVNAVAMGFFFCVVFSSSDIDNFVNGDEHTFNIRNRLVDGPVTKPYPQRSAMENETANDVLFRKVADTETVTQKFTEDGRTISNSDTILFNLLFIFLLFYGSMISERIYVSCWPRFPYHYCFSLFMLIISLIGIAFTWVFFSVKLCYNFTSSWTITFIPLFLTIITMHLFAFNMEPSQNYDFETICSKSVRCCGIVFGSAIGIAIVLIPLLCLDGIGKFDPPTSSGKAWEGAERFMSAVIVTDELIERAHKMERNMILSLVPMLVWFVVVLAAFWAALYLLMGDVKWVKQRVDSNKELLVWQELAPCKRGREMQEIRAEEWKRRKAEKIRKNQEEQERKEKAKEKAKAKEKREKEKEQRLINVIQRGLSVEELSAEIDEINKYYDKEDQKEAEAEEAEKKRAEEEAKKKKENAKMNRNQGNFNEPLANHEIHVLWEKILRKGSFSWLV